MVYFYLIKTGKIEDKDGDLIADDVEEVVEDVKRLQNRQTKSQES